MSRNLCSRVCGTCNHYQFNEEDIIHKIMTYNDYRKDIKLTRYSNEPCQEYRFTKVTCLLCGAIYAAWLTWEDTGGEWSDELKRYLGAYEVVDLSYYYSFNDEPSDEDKGEWPKG